MSNNYLKAYLGAKILVLLLAIYFLGAYLFVATARIGYPLELEWMEGGILDHVARIMQGQPIYTAPSAEWIPFIYPPLYYYLAAGIGSLFGLSFFTLRIISLLASIGCMWLVYQFVVSEHGDEYWASVAVGIYAACYGICGYWYDIGRVDSLCLFFILTSAWCIRFGKSNWSYLLASISMCLAIFTKQSAFLVPPAMALYLLATGKFGGWAILASCIIICGIGVHWLAPEWYTYYTGFIPGHHQLNWSVLLTLWTKDLLPLLGFLSIIGYMGYKMIQMTIKYRYVHPPNLFYILFGLAMTCISFSGRLHSGGYINVLMPICVCIAIWVGITIPLYHCSKRKHDIIILGLVAIQFFVLLYNPFAQVPTAIDLEHGMRATKMIRELPGNAWISSHGGYAIRGIPSTHSMALADVLRSETPVKRDALIADVVTHITNQKWDAIVFDLGPTLQPIKTLAKIYYKKTEIIYPDGDVYMPVVGMQTRPTAIYIKKEYENARDE